MWLLRVKDACPDWSESGQGWWLHASMLDLLAWQAWFWKVGVWYGEVELMVSFAWGVLGP